MNQELRVPTFCPVCSGLMKGKSTSSWYDYGCCINCQIWFVEARPDKIEAWKRGWRPSPEQIMAMKEGMGLV